MCHPNVQVIAGILFCFYFIACREDIAVYLLSGVALCLDPFELVTRRSAFVARGLMPPYVVSLSEVKIIVSSLATYHKH